MKQQSIGEDLLHLKDHLHEALSTSVVARAQALEKELEGIIERTNRYTSQLEQLMEFSSILNTSLDTSRVRELAMKATCKLLHSEGATLYLIDEEKKELYFEAIVGSLASQQLREIRLEISESSIAGTVALKRKSILINDMKQEKRHFKLAEETSRTQTRNMVCVPLESKGKLLGVLQAINHESGDFDAADLRLLETLSHQVAIAVENAKLFENVKTQFIETSMAFASAIDAKDRYTGGHTKRVALFSVLIAKYMGKNAEEIEDIRLAANLHDIGKIGVDDRVLKKEAPLDREEWEHMKLHPEFGYKILAHVKSMKLITDGMRYHHERPDGLGYPLGLKGEEIPEIARIISVADTFDAMTSNRPYRRGMDYDTAFEEIVSHRGTQFDEKVVDAFIKAFKLERMGKRKKDS